MTSADIVERLRIVAGPFGQLDGFYGIAAEAADEIERLRAYIDVLEKSRAEIMARIIGEQRTEIERCGKHHDQHR